MKISQILAGVQVLQSTANMNLDITNLTNDSRNVAPGGLFVAVPGLTQDGASYAKQAISAGALAVISETRLDGQIPQIIVPNARKALAQAAAAFYEHPQSKIKIIGVTGTNGKTTVCQLVAHVLKSAGHKVGVIGTNGYYINDTYMPATRTTPESDVLYALLANMVEQGCEYAVMEVSSHSLALHRVEGLTFEVGVFTNLSQDHLNFHNTMEEYLRVKATMFEHCRVGVVNFDDEYAKKIIENRDCPITTYSTETNEADIVAKSIKLSPDGAEFVVGLLTVIKRIKTTMPGMFNVYNTLAAIQTCLCLGMELEQISEYIKTAKMPKGRCEVLPLDKEYTVMIDYAHTPDGLENVIKAVKGFATGRVVTLFGCGGVRDKEKRPVMGKLGTDLSDFAIITSDNPRTEEPGEIIEHIMAGVTADPKRYVVIPDRVEAIKYAIKNARKDDFIILAGKGQETYQEIKGVQYHLDEREVVLAAVMESDV